MSDYIKREDAYEVLTNLYHHQTETQHRALREALAVVPYTDAVPVVRCYECKYFTEFEKGFSSDWDGSCRYWNTHSTVYSNFCGCGARMDKDD